MCSNLFGVNYGAVAVATLELSFLDRNTVKRFILERYNRPPNNPFFTFAAYVAPSSTSDHTTATNIPKKNGVLESVIS